MINRLKPALIAFMLVFAVAFLVPAVLFPATAAAAVDLDDSSIDVEAGDEITITGELDDEDLNVDDVEWDYDGDDIIDDIEIDYDDYTFEATITISDDADDGDECTITFTVYDDEGDDYDVDLDVTVEGGASSDVEVQTNSATDIGADYATLNGEVTDDNGLDIDEFGFYYGTEKSEVADGEDGNADNDEARGDEDDFYLKLDDLDEDETYYFMAYAIDEDDDIAYGSVKSFTTKAGASGTPSIFTLGSNIYSLRGATQVMDVAPYAKNNRTYLPVRYVAYTMGLTDDQIRWSPLIPNTVTLTNGTTTVILNIGSPIMYKNGVPMMMDVAPEVSNYRTCLPIAWVAQAFGYTATWDGALKVTISGSGTSTAKGEVDLDDDSLTLEPGDDETITGTLDADGRDIEDVDYEVDGDRVVSVDIDINGDEFEATIEVDNDADDGDECTITFTVTDEDGNEYEVECDVMVEDDSSGEVTLEDDSITLEPGEDTTVTGTLDVDGLDIDDVDWDFDGDNIVSVDIDIDGDSFDATIEADSDAEDGDECIITFIVTDEDGDDWEVELEVFIEE